MFLNEKFELNILEHFSKYKALNSHTKLFPFVNKELKLELKIYNKWVGEALLSTFLNMIFQNADDHGKENENDFKILVIEESSKRLIFRNNTWYEKEAIPEKLTGNLLLFSELINKSTQMKMIIDSGNYEFKLTLIWIE